MYENEKRLLIGSPMSSYVDAHPNSLPDFGVWTGLYRGYWAHHTIEQDSVFLHDMTDHRQKSFFDYFISKTELKPVNNRVHMNWFTGNFILTVGKPISMEGWEIVLEYKQYVILKIENGMVVGKETISYEEWEERRGKGEFHY